MKEKIKALYNRSSLATKIRYSYLLLLVPIVTFLIFCFVNMWTSNQKYEDMINSTVVSGSDGIFTMYFFSVGLLEFPEESCAVKVNVYSPALGFGN